MSFTDVDGVRSQELTSCVAGAGCAKLCITLYQFWSKAGGFLRRRCNMIRRANVRSKDIQRISMLGRIVGVTIAADWKGIRRR